MDHDANLNQDQKNPCAEDKTELVDYSELASLNERRIKTYALLARLYEKEVDEACLKQLKQARFPVETQNAKADEGYRLMATYLSNAGVDALTELGRDFVRCFMGQGMSSFEAAYPYESVYTSQKRLLMQDARDEVLAILRSEGFSKKDTWKETEDHLGLELEFMQVLADRTGKALEKDDGDAAATLLKTQRNFLSEHVVSWTPMFTEDVRKFAKTSFYRGLSCLTDGFLELDLEFLSSIELDDSNGSD